MSVAWSFPGGSDGKEPPCQCRRLKRCGFDPWVRKIPWRREWLPTLVFLTGEFDAQWSLAGYSPWGCKESDSIEQLTHTTIPNIYDRKRKYFKILSYASLLKANDS